MADTSTGHDRDDIDRLLDLLPEPPMSWQRKVIRNVIGALTPDQLFCHQPPGQQIRMGLSYPDLMEHHSIEVMRSGQHRERF